MDLTPRESQVVERLQQRKVAPYVEPFLGCFSQLEAMLAQAGQTAPPWTQW